MAELQEVNRELAQVLQKKETQEWIQFFNLIGVPVSRVNTIPKVLEDEWLRDRLLTARDERTGTIVHLPPPAVITDFLKSRNLSMEFPPRLGEDNEAIYGAVGLDVKALKEKGVI
jgi:formyl-CoA transferase